MAGQSLVGKGGGAGSCVSARDNTHRGMWSARNEANKQAKKKKVRNRKWQIRFRLGKFMCANFWVGIWREEEEVLCDGWSRDFYAFRFINYVRGGDILDRYVIISFNFTNSGYRYRLALSRNNPRSMNICFNHSSFQFESSRFCCLHKLHINDQKSW